MNSQNFNCPICTSNKIKFLIEKNNFYLYKCKNCDLIFLYPLSESANEIYTKNYFSGAKNGFGYVDYEKDKEAMRKIFDKYLNEIEKFLPKKGKLLDVGAATGYFLTIAKKRSWEVKGIEISQYAVQEARKKELDVFWGNLKEANFPSSSFEVITFFDTLEHLKNVKETIKEAYRILKKDGLIVINTPDSGSFFAKIAGKYWHILVPPEHIFLFSQKSLSLLLEKYGFKILLVKRIGKNFTLQYIFQILANRYKLSILQKIASYLKNSSFAEFSIPFNFGDNIFLVGKKYG